MAYSEWAYDASVATPANTVDTDWRAIDAKTEGTRGQGAYVNGTAADLNPLGVYPVTRTGSPPDRWYVRDQANDVPAYIPGDGGQLYQITEAFREMTYPEARALARNIITDYFLAYDQSQFTIQSQTFSAQPDQAWQYFKLRYWVLGWPGGTPPAEPYDPPQVVIDIEGDANQFTTAAKFKSFWDRFEALNQEARSVSWNAWKAVQDATTTEQVRQIVAGLPPVPGAA